VRFTFREDATGEEAAAAEMLLPDLAGDSGEGDNSHQMTEGRQSGKAEIDGGRLLEAARGSPALPRSAVPPRR
jgi:hypothetical protein